MKKLIELLNRDTGVSAYKINTTKKESSELFFVRGRLETARSTDTYDRQVTVYADHGDFRGDSVFYVYPSMTEEDIRLKIREAVMNALLISNPKYELPQGEEEEYTLHSSFEEEDMPRTASRIADIVFDANKMEKGSLNSVEVFVNHYTTTVINSRGLHKVQHRYTAMVEAIPTYYGENQSVELYEQYNVSTLDEDALIAEIASKMQEVKARCEAVKPDPIPQCKVVLNRHELLDMFTAFADDLNYSTVYSHSNLWHKGDMVQKEPSGDLITLQMKGRAEGNINSSYFDGDGMPLGEITLIDRGAAVNYYGSNRFGQYLKEKPTGNLSCLVVSPGTADDSVLEGENYLEVLSMSGLQVDLFNNYIGGEIRLAYYHEGKTVRPVTGISFSGDLQKVLDSIRLYSNEVTHDYYTGPEKAVLSGVKIF